ncbi:MAG: tetratricopeptide repeat protein [Pseudomonadota bacterium]
MRVLISVLLILAGAMSTASAQIVDPRVLQLEEQLRQLNGRIEELNFQLLQMQEQLRRQQEDNEFRLQQLEDREQGSLVPAQTPGSVETQVASTGDLTLPEKQDRVIPSPQSGQPELGEPPRSLGSLTVSETGQVVGATIDFSDAGIRDALDGNAVASIGGARNPEELYEIGYRHILSGEYALAEGVFQSFVEIYPNDPLIADAYFWLAESMLAQGRFEDAGDTFVELRTMYPQARKTSETMLKIGTIMAALGNRDLACATFTDAVTSQPAMAETVRSRIEEEAARAQC